ncbi:MAG: hypothetical protein QGM49_07990, partial [Actinomycetota bacterium]|nr:hypothetical protein [Actinomycetota bacterium]
RGRWAEVRGSEGASVPHHHSDAVLDFKRRLRTITEEELKQQTSVIHRVEHERRLDDVDRESGSIPTIVRPGVARRCPVNPSPAPISRMTPSSGKIALSASTTFPGRSIASRSISNISRLSTP